MSRSSPYTLRQACLQYPMAEAMKLEDNRQEEAASLRVACKRGVH